MIETMRLDHSALLKVGNHESAGLILIDPVTLYPSSFSAKRPLSVQSNEFKKQITK